MAGPEEGGLSGGTRGARLLGRSLPRGSVEQPAAAGGPRGRQLPCTPAAGREMGPRRQVAGLIIVCWGVKGSSATYDGHESLAKLQGRLGEAG